MSFDTLASPAIVERTATALTKKGYLPVVVADVAAALAKVREIIPAGATTMNGASKTLEQIGYPDLVRSGKSGWNDLHAPVWGEKDPAKRALARKQATLSEYYVGSVAALTETGEFLNASNTGSQLPHIAYNSHNLVFVVSTKKIVPNMAEAMRRLEDHVFPQEDQNMRTLYKIGTQISKILITRQENLQFSGRKIHFVLVSANVGF